MNKPTNQRDPGERGQPFSLRARLKSFVYAFEGLRQFLNAQHNALVHLFATVTVIALGFVLKLRTTEWLFISFAIGGVWAAELFNSAMEKLCDLVSPGYNRQVKYIKDVAAAAVLVSAIVAVAVGLIIFIPKIFA